MRNWLMMLLVVGFWGCEGMSSPTTATDPVDAQDSALVADEITPEDEAEALRLMREQVALERGYAQSMDCTILAIGSGKGGFIPEDNALGMTNKKGAGFADFQQKGLIIVMTPKKTNQDITATKGYKMLFAVGVC